MSYQTSDSSEMPTSALFDEARDPLVDDTNIAGWRVDGSKDLGVGKPFEATERRDFTVKASRRPAPTPPTPESTSSSLTTSPLASVIPLPESPATEAAPTKKPALRRPTHRYTSSTSSVPSRSTHAPIPDPHYSVRSQPVGLLRSTSIHEPTLSGGIVRRGSISASEDEEDEEDEIKSRQPVNRPVKHRSESLPTFSTDEAEVLKRLAEEQQRKERQLQAEYDNLPTSPKLWLPSQVALYITHTLRLHPRLADDITQFVRTSRLDGRTFLRLKDGDMEELGIAVPWRKALGDARDKLRKEQLGGRVLWGFEGVRYGDPEEKAEDVAISMSEESSAPVRGGQRRPSFQRRRSSFDVEGSDLEEETGKEEWKRSWRMLQGGKRVRGIISSLDRVEGSRDSTPYSSPAKALSVASEDDGKPKRSSRVFPPGFDPSASLGHGQEGSADSNMSAASIDSGSGFSGDGDGASSANANTYAYKAPPSLSTHSLSALARHPSLHSHFSPDTNSLPSTTFTSPHHASRVVHHLVGSQQEDDAPATTTDPLDGNSPPSPVAEPGPHYQSAISSHARPYGLVRRPSEKRATVFVVQRDLPSGGEEEASEGTGLTTVRGASETSTSAGFGAAGVAGEKRLGLSGIWAEVEVPRVTAAGEEGAEVGEGDELMEMEVPARGEKKGSMVMVKRSQLAELSKRMAEVETQVALAHGLYSTAPSEFGADELEELEQRLHGIESLLPLTAPVSPARSTRSYSTTTQHNADAIAIPNPQTPLTSHTQILSTWVTASLSSRSLSELATTSHESARQLMDASGPLMSWTALGGYCIAASLGIGLVAGEVVVGRLLGIRRRP